jgi:hypothetical protein
VRCARGEMDDLQGDNDAEERWKEACRREEARRDLLSRNPDGLKGRDVADLAWELGLSRATAYRMIRLFRAGGTVTSLIDRTRGRREGFRTLDKEREEIIGSARSRKLGPSPDCPKTSMSTTGPIFEVGLSSELAGTKASRSFGALVANPILADTSNA